MTTSQFSDRRTGIERRVRNERRAGPDRRSGFDRRLLAAEAANQPNRGIERAATADATHGAPLANEPRPPLPVTERDFVSGFGSVLTDLVATFYDSSMDPKLWPTALSKLRDALHADVCAIASHDFKLGVGRLEHTVNFDAMYVAAYSDYYAQQNLWFANGDAFRATGTVWTSQQLADDARVVESDFFRYWLRPQDLFHHLFGVVDTQNDRAVILLFARAAEKGAFWQDDATLLAKLLPNLRRGWLAGQCFRRVKDVQRIALDALDAMPVGLGLLSGSGNLIASNRLAREIIDNEDMIYIGTGGLSVKLATGRLRFRDVLSGAFGRASGEHAGELHCVTVPRPAPRRPLTLLTLPLKDRTQPRGVEDPIAVVFIGDPERPVDIDPRRLIRLYGLSRAESRVAVLLGQGQRLEQIAEALGLTYETVRKHLKQIFIKTGTDRQAELVRTLVTGPGGLRL